MKKLPLLDALARRFSLPNKVLLQQAFTHSSYAHAHRLPDNERLEFLGDAILSAVVAETLYAAYPDLPEGELTRLRAQAVQGRSLAVAARELGLSSHLRHLVSAPSAKAEDNLLEQAFEALVGALFLEKGYDNTKAQVLQWLPIGSDAIPSAFNPKGALQELLQPKIPTAAIIYKLLKTEGPDHERRFTVALMVEGKKIATASAPSKKAAEELAAKRALKILSADDRPARA